MPTVADLELLAKALRGASSTTSANSTIAKFIEDAEQYHIPGYARWEKGQLQVWVKGGPSRYADHDSPPTFVVASEIPPIMGGLFRQYAAEKVDAAAELLGVQPATATWDSASLKENADAVLAAAEHVQDASVMEKIANACDSGDVMLALSSRHGSSASYRQAAVCLRQQHVFHACVQPHHSDHGYTGPCAEHNTTCRPDLLVYGDDDDKESSYGIVEKESHDIVKILCNEVIRVTSQHWGLLVPARLPLQAKKRVLRTLEIKG